MRHQTQLSRLFAATLTGILLFPVTALAQTPPGAPTAPTVGSGDATSDGSGEAETATSDVTDDAAKALADAKKKADEDAAAKAEAEAKAAEAKAAEAKAAEAKATEAKAATATEAKADEAKGDDAAEEEPAAPVNCDEVCAKKEEGPKGPQQGFNYTLSLGITGSLLHSLAVVGQPDGLTMQLGGVLNGGVLYLRKNHSWETKLNIQNAWTLTPALPNSPIKSADRIDLSTQYTYGIPIDFLSWLGPYARAQLVTSALPGQLVVGAPTAVQKNLRTGELVLEESAGTQKNPATFALTGFFEPLVINENVGITAVSPFDEITYFVPKARLGLGGQHVLVRDGFSIADDGATSFIELNQMSTENSFGMNADFEVTGKLLDNVFYGLIARLYYPLFIFEDNTADFVDRVNTDILGTISFQLLENLKLNYALTVRRIPAVSEDWQIQNSVLISAGFNIL